MKPTRVANAHYERPIEGRFIDRSTIFGNPIRMGQPCPECTMHHVDRENLVECFELYARRRFKEDMNFRNEVLSLEGSILLCWCSPQKCHGDVYVKILQETLG